MADNNNETETNSNDQELDLEAQESQIAKEFLQQLNGLPEDLESENEEVESTENKSDELEETEPDDKSEVAKPGNLDAKAFVAARRAQRERDEISKAHTANQSELEKAKGELKRYMSLQDNRNPGEILSTFNLSLKDISDWLEADGNIDKMANMPSKEVQALQNKVAELEQDRQNRAQAEQQRLEQEQNDLVQKLYNDVQVVIDEGDYPCCKALNAGAVVLSRVNEHWLEDQTILEYSDATSAIENEILESLRSIPKETLFAKLYPEENTQKEVTPGKKRAKQTDKTQTNTLSNSLSSDSGTQLNLTDASDEQLAKQEARLHAQWLRENT
jgi:hypothetical protein